MIKMKKLVFNTTEKTVVLYSDMESSKVILRINETPTVKVCPEGFYEVFVRDPKNGHGRPKVRIPINEVIMFIQD